MSGELSPGDRLVQDVLAVRLGISRTPVREALQRLEREGTIRSAGGRSHVVPELTHEDIAHLYEVREAVEGQAARLVATRAAASAEDTEEAGSAGSGGGRRAPWTAGPTLTG